MSAQIIPLPAPARRLPPGADKYAWLRADAVRLMRAAPAEATPAPPPETAEILAILRRIERRLARK